jgi:hypothetical protein
MPDLASHEGQGRLGTYRGNIPFTRAVKKSICTPPYTQICIEINVFSPFTNFLAKYLQRQLMHTQCLPYI